MSCQNKTFCVISCSYCCISCLQDTDFTTEINMMMALLNIQVRELRRALDVHRD